MIDVYILQGSQIKMVSLHCVEQELVVIKVWTGQNPREGQKELSYGKAHRDAW